MPTYFIPFSFLGHFGLTEDRKDHGSPGAFGTLSVLDRLRLDGKSFYLESFTSLGTPSTLSDSDRMALALDGVKQRHALTLVYIGEMDLLGHRYGPDSSEVRDGLEALDARLRIFASDVWAADPEATILFLGDHGMVPVNGGIDVRKAMVKRWQRTKLVPGRDFLYFLDSTICRIWWFSDIAEAELASMFTEEPIFYENGTVATKPSPRSGGFLGFV